MMRLTVMTLIQNKTRYRWGGWAVRRRAPASPRSEGTCLTVSRCVYNLFVPVQKVAAETIPAFARAEHFQLSDAGKLSIHSVAPAPELCVQIGWSWGWCRWTVSPVSEQKSKNGMVWG